MRRNAYIVSNVLLWAAATLTFWCPASAGIKDEAGDLPPEVRASGMTHQIFSDEFDNLSLSPGDQSADKQFNWYNSLWYMKPGDPSLITASQGVLTLRSQPNGRETSITTISRNGLGGHVFRQGYFEARMKWAGSAKAWPAFWLFSADHMMNTDNSHWCEIDIFEGHHQNVFSGTVHDWIKSKDTSNPNSMQPMGMFFDSNEWHTYGLLFDGKTLTWFLDRKRVMSAPAPEVCRTQRLFLILTSQLNGTGPGLQTDGSKSYPALDLKVDWVRVYDK